MTPFLLFDPKVKQDKPQYFSALQEVSANQPEQPDSTPSSSTPQIPDKVIKGRRGKTTKVSNLVQSQSSLNGTEDWYLFV